MPSARESDWRASGPSAQRLRNRAQVLFSPSLAWSVGPVVFELPREPTTRALTIRGESPRFSTLTFRSLPLNRPPRRDSISPCEKRARHVWYGEILS